MSNRHLGSSKYPSRSVQTLRFTRNFDAFRRSQNTKNVKFLVKHNVWKPPGVKTTVFCSVWRPPDLPPGTLPGRHFDHFWVCRMWNIMFFMPGAFCDSTSIVNLHLFLLLIFYMSADVLFLWSDWARESVSGLRAQHSSVFIVRSCAWSHFERASRSLLKQVSLQSLRHYVLRGFGALDEKLATPKNTFFEK